MEKLKKYQAQIFNVITIFLILEFAIFPGLTSANTIMNILAGVGLLLLVLWGGLVLYNYIRSSEGGLVDANELKEAESTIQKKKRNPKQFDGVKSEEPFIKTRNKSVHTKTK